MIREDISTILVHLPEERAFRFRGIAIGFEREIYVIVLVVHLHSRKDWLLRRDSGFCSWSRRLFGGLHVHGLIGKEQWHIV